jgi:hypothetical protein
MEAIPFGIVMIIIASLIVLGIALPYWTAIGEPLRAL